jgi:hypothetical protein
LDGKQSGQVFNSKVFVWWRDKRGEIQHSIDKREYIACIGDVGSFKKYLVEVAIRNKCGHYKNAIIISDGAI